MIKNAAVINEDTTANFQQLKNEIRKLKMRISELELEKASMSSVNGTAKDKSFLTPKPKGNLNDAEMQVESMQHLRLSPSLFCRRPA